MLGEVGSESLNELVGNFNKLFINLRDLSSLDQSSGRECFAQNFSKIFCDFIDQGFKTRGVNVIVLDLLFLRIDQVLDQFRADFGDLVVGNSGNYFREAFNCVALGGE